MLLWETGEIVSYELSQVFAFRERYESYILLALYMSLCGSNNHNLDTRWPYENLCFLASY